MLGGLVSVSGCSVCRMCFGEFEGAYDARG